MQSSRLGAVVGLALTGGKNGADGDNVAAAT